MSSSIFSILLSIPWPLMESLWWALWSLSEWVWTSLLMEPRYNRAAATAETRSDPLIQPDLILVLLCMSCALFGLALKGEEGFGLPLISGAFSRSLHPLHTHTYTNTVTHTAVIWYPQVHTRFAGSEGVRSGFHSAATSLRSTWGARCKPLAVVTWEDRKPAAVCR